MRLEQKGRSVPFYFDGTSTVALQSRHVIHGPGRVSGLLITGAVVGTLVTLKDGSSAEGKIIAKYRAAAVANMDAATDLALDFDNGLFIEVTPADVNAAVTVTVEEPESGTVEFNPAPIEEARPAPFGKGGATPARPLAGDPTKLPAT